ncbi:hypothetical protein CYME_CME040C [Cyanidioschyzon merolae strain 10D]|jgi:hypothetical protein|uniref:Ribosomal protein eL8/eL30/eS12/Gadd45 domain-containing protein n=1 Tax=Cyanidioschyzon merolae (strain NIES-3377 / 10D) TaxID=280699 RepID=M1UPC2_CYAM1|nr:hypothetical protein CYME_CME040C [Cyanidioschyzon merolae strain 10D]BAM79271.1 hypothetical protein CYME_CME040C [Cyanidioschyzon merolae strain 10D]|eukprot:XP_005535557.1 hypothetical protein CYME_CME040C [Cyanidioschyzon merolae strain 10D]
MTRGVSITVRNPNTLDNTRWIVRHRGKKSVKRSRAARFLSKSGPYLHSNDSKKAEQKLVFSCSHSQSPEKDLSLPFPARSEEASAPLCSARGSPGTTYPERRFPGLLPTENSQSLGTVTAVKQLLRKLIKFQARLARDQSRKLRAHKRYVCGIRECTRLLRAKQCLLLIVPSNGILPCAAANLQETLALAEEHSVPIIRDISATELCRLLRRVQASRLNARPACCVGVKSCEGASLEMQRVFDALALQAGNIYPTAASE